MTIRRREVALALGATLGGSAGAFARPSPRRESIHSAQADGLEVRLGGRLGLAIYDLGSGLRLRHRGDERFPMCSTVKFLAAAQALRRVDDGQEDLRRRILLARDDIVPHSPVTEGRVGRAGLTVAELCEAMITHSDNTALNLLLPSLGGPAGLTDFMRSQGDDETRLDRFEPALNEGRPGDPRDTTTPNAMLTHLRRFLFEDALSPASRDLLTKWLVTNKTGDARLRAGVPDGWMVGDKTGANGRGTTNDIGFLQVPGGKPILVAAFITEATAAAAVQDAALAEIGALASGHPERA